MPIDVSMPALSPTMTEGTLAKWVKQEGDTVEAGDTIAEIETDKATMEVEAVDEGILGKILIPEGTEGVPVNQVIALLLEEGEDAAILEGYTAPEAPGNAAPETGNASAAAAAESSGATPDVSPPVAAGRVFASPLAKRLAAEAGINIGRISGTGPRGRVVKADVEGAAPQSTPAAAASAPQRMPDSGRQRPVPERKAPLQVGRITPEVTEVKPSGMRKTIAKRLLESKQTIPHFYLTVEVAMDALLNARKELNAMAAAQVADGDTPPPYKISVNDFVIRACALALRDIPEANASWIHDTLHQYANVDIAVAVAIDGGLVTPVVRNADQKDLPATSNEMKDLARRARNGKLAPEEYQGGGFSISNLGMYGIRQFNAIINPPQSCILAVGASEEKIVLKNGAPVAHTVMHVTLSADHRVVDGAVGAEYLSAFKRYMEHPLAMIL